MAMQPSEVADAIDRLRADPPRRFIAIHPSDPRATFLRPHQHPIQPGQALDPDCLHCKIATRPTEVHYVR